MYKARTYEEILKEIQDYSKSDLSKFEGTFEYDVFSSNAYEFSKTEIEIEEMYKQVFATTATGDYLTMRASEFGVDRRMGTKAHGTITVQGTGLLSSGTLFTTDDGLNYATTADNYLTGTTEIEVQAVEVGARYNVLANSIKKAVSNSVVQKIEQQKPITGGYDTETDETLRERLFDKVREPAVSGNKAQYRQWALSIAGVGQAKVLDLWNGNGTVKVLILNDNGEVADDELKKRVADYIETVRPIGATVTIDSPRIKLININVKLTGVYDADTIKRELQVYINKNGLNSEHVSYAHIGNVILTSEGVQDAEGLTINGGNANISIAVDEIPVIGEVVING